MLRSWTERIHIYLHPERIALVRDSGLFRRRVTIKLAIPVEAVGEQAWDGALATLQSALQRPEWQGASATVILSGHFASFRIAPWDPRLNEEERTTLLHHQFGEVYGEAARTWRVDIADCGFGKPGLACAVDLRLMATIQDACSSAGIRLVSVKPYLMSAFNRWRREFEAQGAWLVLAEPSCLTIAFIQHGAWRSIRSQHCAPNWEAELELMLAREALQLGVEAAAFTVYFSCPEHPSFRPDLSEQFRVQALHLPIVLGYSPQGDSHIAGALCA